MFRSFKILVEVEINLNYKFCSNKNKTHSLKQVTLLQYQIIFSFFFLIHFNGK